MRSAVLLLCVVACTAGAGFPRETTTTEPTEVATLEPTDSNPYSATTSVASSEDTIAPSHTPTPSVQASFPPRSPTVYPAAGDRQTPSGPPDPKVYHPDIVVTANVIGCGVLLAVLAGMIFVVLRRADKDSPPSAPTPTQRAPLDTAPLLVFMD